MIYLSEEDVSTLLTMEDALEAVREALAAVARGEGANAPRTRSSHDGLNLNLLGGAVRESVGAKIYVTGGGAAKFWGMLFGHGGELRALYEADRLGQLRTGAASGVSADLLARPESRELAMIGSGYQARTQALAIAASRPIERVRVSGRNPENARAFAAWFTGETGIAAEAAGSLEEALDGADIVASMTSATEPILRAEHVRAGTHYVFAGSNNPRNAEAEPAALAAIDLIVTDEPAQARAEGGTLLRAVAAGALDWDRVGTLGGVLAGTEPGRTGGAQTTAFVSHGVGSWDTALAERLFKKATAAGRGVQLPIDGAPVRGRR